MDLYIHNVIVDGTEELRADAINKVGVVVTNADLGWRFIGLYSHFKKHESKHDEPLSTDPHVLEAFSALGVLEEACIDNIMRHDSLNMTFDSERERAAGPYLIKGICFGVVEDSLGRS